jgi:hypothetical protein
MLADWLINIGMRLSSGDRWVAIKSNDPQVIRDIKKKIYDVGGMLK